MLDPHSPASATPGTVLVVDDNPTNLSLLSDLLDGAGLSVRVAKSGAAAIDRVAFARPDLILLDVMMPEMDGFEACQRLQRDPQTRDIPIIFMTALSDAADKVKGLNLGAVDYITKPFQQEEVLARVRLHLRLHQLNVELAAANQQLEARVADRTADLERAIEDLKSAQVRLIQSEQLSSLGDIAAGAAYEIGNALNVLTGNLTYASDRCEELIEIVQCYRQRYPQADQDMADRWQAIDLDFIKSDLPVLMASLHTGIRRIQNVTDILQDFSTPNESDCRVFHLHASLDNIMTLLKQRLKGRGNRPPITVRREYGELLPFNAYPGPLNQALTHLLTNAIEAIEVRCANEPAWGFIPELQVQTQAQDIDGEPWAIITIVDNGIGMSESVRDRAFQPFFTTKPATKASGLGLALCQTTIVELHGGAIDCDSQPDQGTKVIIRLPLHRLPAATAPNPTVVSLSSPPSIPE
jgi:signal transduction histidine kinase